MRNPRCCKCFKELQEGDWRQKTKQGVICGPCYDRLIREIGWGNYAPMYDPAFQRQRPAQASGGQEEA